MPGGGLQRKDSKNIIVGNWGTQPSNFQQGDTANYVPNNMNTSSNPFTVSSHFLSKFISTLCIFTGIK